MSIHDEYRNQHPKSAALAERARRAIPGGITHDIRHLTPFPIYVESAQGTKKRDVDGHEYVDYWMGHGALFLGHCHPEVVKAVQEQMARGTHLGASHELEVRWAELVNRLVPCAELTRFTMSGTEATHLAMRIARACSVASAQSSRVAMAAAADSGLALKVPAWATRCARSQSGSPRNASIDMSWRLPHRAPPGSPPATIFASVVRSGVTP